MGFSLFDLFCYDDVYHGGIGDSAFVGVSLLLLFL